MRDTIWVVAVFSVLCWYVIGMSIGMAVSWRPEHSTQWWVSAAISCAAWLFFSCRILFLVYKVQAKSIVNRRRRATDNPPAEEEMITDESGWIGVDLDGTLAEYDEFRGVEHIGKPIAAMASRVSTWLDRGVDVRIFTARVDGGTAALAEGNTRGEQFVDVERVRSIIQDWTEEHFGVRLPVTNSKDYSMRELWDDRCVCVERNTGKILGRNRLVVVALGPTTQARPRVVDDLVEILSEVVDDGLMTNVDSWRKRAYAALKGAEDEDFTAWRYPER